MAIEKLRMPTGAVLVTVNIEKFKWNFKGSDIKNNNEPSGTDPANLVVKDLGSNITKPSKWKSISECIFRVKKIDSKSKLTSDLDLKEGSIFYYNKYLLTKYLLHVIMPMKLMFYFSKHIAWDIHTPSAQQKLQKL